VEETGKERRELGSHARNKAQKHRYVRRNREDNRKV